MSKVSLRKMGKLNFAERFYPARPQRLIKLARKIAKRDTPSLIKYTAARASNRLYIKWLRNQSMLNNAEKQATMYSGKGRQWQNPYARPQPRSAVNKASVWYTAYPISMITDQKESTLSALGNEKLWQVFSEIGIKAIHTGPMKKAGGLRKWKSTPTIDGHFDRVSNSIDPIFGSEEEFRQLCEVANNSSAIVIDDIVPGHTGKGADFRLAEMNYKDYPGIYHMVEIEKQDWHLLPSVRRGRTSENISAEVEEVLKKKGYIIGRLPRVIFYEPGVKETNWSATRTIKGVDGISRRWVYLHYFKEGQPSINWLDPSFAGMKLVIGDALHSMGYLGSGGLRLDANGFLGIEKSNEDSPAWSEGHPLSQAANHFISSTVRKFDGFTFQELNLSIDDIKTMSQDGADLSYDFINRPAYQHALLTSDTEFLQLMLRNSLELDVDPAALVHAMQNHDELTYELVHFWTIHKDDSYEFRGKKILGSQLRETVRSELKDTLTTNKGYNLLFTDNGVACTTATVITAALGFKDIHNLSDDQIEEVKKAHLLLVMFNAFQPGVFAISGWDLVGSLTLESEKVKTLIQEGDTRWVNRGAYDLLGNHTGTQVSTAGMQRAENLYGDLVSQLSDKSSFVSQLKDLLRVRHEYSIATARQLDIPQVSNKAILAMLHKAENDNHQMTILNFSSKPQKATITSVLKDKDISFKNAISEDSMSYTLKNGKIDIALEPLQGTILVEVKGD